MKKFLAILALLLVGMNAQAEVLEVETVGDMKNFWESNGRYEQKVLNIGTKIINENKLDKRIPIQLSKKSEINACSYRTHKTIVINYGILPYIDNDDELAYIIGHETTHSLDSYGGFLKWTDMTLNSKEYEHKADLGGIDLMAKAGYNPVAAITCANKWMPESYWDFGIFTSHPKTSKRLLKMYEYIYVKYPWALKSDMTQNVNYQNFLNSSKKEREEFIQHKKEHEIKQHNIEDL